MPATPVIAAALMLAAQVALAQSVAPLPPPRPVEVPSPAKTPAPPREAPLGPNVDAPPNSANADSCVQSLRAAGFEIEPAEQPKSSNDLCRIEAPVRLKRVPVPAEPATAVRLTDEPVLACRFAGPFGRWIGDLVAPLIVGAKGTELRAVRTGPGYECRNRNGAATGKLSAHAAGLAIDIAAFELANGSTLLSHRFEPPPADGLRPFWAPARTRRITTICMWTSSSTVRAIVTGSASDLSKSRSAKQAGGQMLPVQCPDGNSQWRQLSQSCQGNSGAHAASSTNTPKLPK
jgi:hypothetical protein